MHKKHLISLYCIIFIFIYLLLLLLFWSEIILYICEILLPKTGNVKSNPSWAAISLQPIRDQDYNEANLLSGAAKTFPLIVCRIWSSYLVLFTLRVWPVLLKWFWTFGMFFLPVFVFLTHICFSWLCFFSLSWSFTETHSSSWCMFPLTPSNLNDCFWFFSLL